MWFHCFIPTSTYLFFRFKFLFHREQLDFCTRHALFQSKFWAHQSTTTCAQCYFNFNVSSIDLWPFLSSRTLERRSILYTQQRNHHHHQFFSPNISFPLNPLSTNTSLPFFMGERRRNHKLCFSVTSASYTKQKVIPINSAYFSVTNCMLIIIITYLYPVFKRIIQSCFSFYFSLTWTKLIEKR